ncbi:MAG: electron transport complex subunit RsxC [Oscillospiraceae bacterium]|jgi:electron transport complex protein RnfC|nr:electron transport complex subunit RsxC [Oscillospiraceae bacterium]
MLFRFRGGVHPDDNKAQTMHKHIEPLPPPEYLVLPLSMHSGAQCEPLVVMGDLVFYGQKIADSAAPVSAPIHSPVSGRVEAVEPRPHPAGSLVVSIIIKNDGLDTPDPKLSPYGSVESLTPEELLSIIRETGIVGMSGSSYPTHAKIRSALGKVHTILINGCECEPYVTSDFRLMLEAPEEVVGGLKVLMKIFGLGSGIIAVESNMHIAAESIRKTLPRRTDIQVRTVPARYPQGSERQLVAYVTGREVPAGSFPPAVGCVVFNVETAAAIHRAVTTGLPLIRRVVTVSGNAVSNAKNLLIRIGTPMETVFAATGGFREAPGKVIMGGPMTGVAQFDLKTPIVKGSNALLAFSRSEVYTTRDRTTCIRCGKCVRVCPMKLEPIYLYTYERINRCDLLERYRISDCIECGNCSYICPGRLHLVHSIRTGKQKLAETEGRQ